MLPQPFSSLNGSWERIFWLQDTVYIYKKMISSKIEWYEGRSGGAPYNQLHLSSAVPGWTFPGCMTGSIHLVLHRRHVLWVRKYVQELWVYQNEHSHWTTDLENDTSVQFSSVTQSCPTLWPHESQHARPPCPSPTPGVHSDSCASSQWYHPAISSSVIPFSSCPQSLPASGSFPVGQLFHKVAKVLEFQLQHHSLQRNPRADLLQNGLVGSPCSPRESQESSPTPQFKSISSLALSFLHSPTLTSIHDHWKNHTLD